MSTGDGTYMYEAAVRQSGERVIGSACTVVNMIDLTRAIRVRTSVNANHVNVIR